MADITRRSALKSALAIAAGGMTLSAPAEAATEDPVCTLFREHQALRAEEKELSTQIAKLKAMMPRGIGTLVRMDLAKNSVPLAVQFPTNIEHHRSRVLAAAQCNGSDNNMVEAINAFFDGRLAEMEKAWQRERDLEKQHGITGVGKQSNDLWLRIDAIEKQILETRATTPQGLAVKIWLSGDHRQSEAEHIFDEPDRQLGWDDRLLKSAWQDAMFLEADRYG